MNDIVVARSIRVMLIIHEELGREFDNVGETEWDRLGEDQSVEYRVITQRIGFEVWDNEDYWDRDEEVRKCAREAIKEIKAGGEVVAFRVNSPQFWNVEYQMVMSPLHFDREEGTFYRMCVIEWFARKAESNWSKEGF